MIQTVDIFKSIVSTLTANLVIDLAINNNDGTFTLETTNTYWISELEIYDIDGSDYKIVSLVQNISLLIQPTGNGTIPVVAGFNIPAPLFFNGTLKMAQNEIDNFKNKMELVPFVYLYEVIKDRKNTDDESTVDRECDLRFFFVNSSSFQNMLTEDVYEKVIYPLHPLVELFIAKIKASALFTDVLNYDEINLINFSEEGNQKTSIFDINLSAIEFRLQAEIREVNCNDIYIDPTIICLAASYEVKYLNGTLIESGTISSGGSITITVPNPTGEDAIAVLKDEFGAIISTTNIPCGVTEIIIAPNSTIKVNGNLLSNVASGGLFDINIIYQDLTPVGTIVGDDVIIPNPIVCADATVQNSDLTYNTTVASGGVLVLPNINIRRSDNSVIANIPSVQDYIEEDTTIYNSDGSYTLVVMGETGGTLPDINISDTAANIIATIPSAISYTVPNASIRNSDLSYVQAVLAAELFDLPDTTYDIYLDGVLNQTFAIPTLKTETINISL